MKTRQGTALTTVPKQETRNRSSQIRLSVLALALLSLGVQILGIYYDATWHTLKHTADIRISPDLVVTQLRAGAEEAGFQVGDRLLSLGGQKLDGILDYRQALSRTKRDSWCTVTVQRGDEVLELAVLVKAQRLDPWFFVRNLIALAFLAMGTLVAFQRPEDRAARLFFLTSLALALYFALQQKDAVGLVCLQVVALTLAPALAFHFFLTFPEERWLAKSRWWFLLYLPSLVLMVLTLSAFAQSVKAGTGVFYAPRFDTLTTIGFAYLVLSAILGLVSMGYTYVTTPHSILKRQLQWVIWGLACAIVTSTIDIVLTILQMQSYGVSNLLLLGIIPLLVAFAFAILRYRLLDIDLVVNRSVVYGLLTGTLAAVYLLLISVLSSALGAAAGSGSHILVLFLSALLIGILVNPLRARIQRIIDQTFFRQQVDYQSALIQWSQELSTSLRFAGLTKLLLQEVPRRLMIDHAWLLVLNEDETDLEPLPAGESRDNARGQEDVWRSIEARPEGDLYGGLSFSARSAVADHLIRPGMILLLGSEREKGLPMAVEGIVPTWEQAGVRLVLPLVSGGKLVGVYFLGQKLSGDIYQRQELNLLRTLSNQAAVAIANARLYEQVHAFSQVLEEKVRERTRELRDFVSAVYHELSTPITAIRGYTALVLDGKAGPLNTKQTGYLEAVHRNVRRLLGLVGDLSDVSRIEDGRLTIHPESIDLGAAVTETVNSLSGIIEEKGLQIDIALSPETAAVQGDPQRVVQILTNLVGNACRYTPAGGQITISATKGNGSAELTVQDTGIGIHSDELDRIFERFYRSSDPLVQAHSGTGLGLAITKSLVELHGGRLWVNSTPGKGSTFGFTLPLVQSASQSTDRSQLEATHEW
jgi:signal transduction histidine kinase